jgi:hypothetical protein
MTAATYIRWTNAVLSVALLVSCTSPHVHDCAVLSTHAARTPRAIEAMKTILKDVAATGRVRDACSTEAALELTRMWRITENLPTLRRIARLSLPATVAPADRYLLGDVIADALHTLFLLDDAEAITLGRHHIDSDPSIAGAALIGLLAAGDWQSTAAVATRLVDEADPRRHYSLVWLGLDFLSRSPMTPANGCEVVARLQVFETLPAAELGNPTIARIVATRRDLHGRYNCIEPQ